MKPIEVFQNHETLENPRGGSTSTTERSQSFSQGDMQLGSYDLTPLLNQTTLKSLLSTKAAVNESAGMLIASANLALSQALQIIFNSSKQSGNSIRRLALPTSNGAMIKVQGLRALAQ